VKRRSSWSDKFRPNGLKLFVVLLVVGKSEFLEKMGMVCMYSNLKKEEWSEGEKERLKRVVERYGKNWESMRRFFPGRSAVALKLKWKRISKGEKSFGEKSFGEKSFEGKMGFEGVEREGFEEVNFPSEELIREIKELGYREEDMVRFLRVEEYIRMIEEMDRRQYMEDLRKLMREFDEMNK